MKSTFARELSEIMKCPYIEMDRLFWRPGWQAAPENEFLQSLRNELKQKRWVLDGNYKRTTSIKWALTDTVIWQDYSFARTFCRILKRVYTRVITQEELWPGTGNRASLRLEFFDKKSIILWMLKTYSGTRKKYNAIIKSDEYPYIRFIKFKSPSEAEKCLSLLKKRA